MSGERKLPSLKDVRAFHTAHKGQFEKMKLLLAKQGDLPVAIAMSDRIDDIARQATPKVTDASSYHDAFQAYQAAFTAWETYMEAHPELMGPDSPTAEAPESE